MDSALAVDCESTPPPLGARLRKHFNEPYTRIKRFISSKGTDVSRLGSLGFLLYLVCEVVLLAFLGAALLFFLGNAVGGGGADSLAAVADEDSDANGAMVLGDICILSSRFRLLMAEEEEVGYCWWREEEEAVVILLLVTDPAVASLIVTSSGPSERIRTNSPAASCSLSAFMAVVVDSFSIVLKLLLVDSAMILYSVFFYVLRA